MSNFVEEYKKGQSGGNKGLSMGEGLSNLDSYINGIQRRMVYVIASAPKVGKSTLVDYGFLIQPYLKSLGSGQRVRWIYFSFEIDRVSKEFDLASYFLYRDFGYKSVQVGSYSVPMCSSYLRGRLRDDMGEIIPVTKQVEADLKVVYSERIIPLFGEYDKQGLEISKGLIDYKEKRWSSKQMYDYIKSNTADLSEDIHTIIVTDHLRKIKPTVTLKQAVDEYSEYCVELRNRYGLTFVNIIHTNRSLGTAGNIKFYGEELYPTSENIKDTSNLSEDADYVITLFNPNDDKYQLKEHFNMKIRDDYGNELYPNLRTIHIVESRHCSSPKHFKVEMEGNIKNFKQIQIR